MRDDPVEATAVTGYSASADLPPEICRAAELALERKALGVVGMDLRGISTATDYFLVASGNSDVQVKAIADHIITELKKEDERPVHVEGLQGGSWVLIDYIDFVIHVFHPEAREFYQLEVLWGDAPSRHFEDPSD
jgi:ribosome-associated protein